MCVFFFFQAEDGIRDLVRSRGLGDVYKRQAKVLRIGVELDAARPLQHPQRAYSRLELHTVVGLSLIHI